MLSGITPVEIQDSVMAIKTGNHLGANLGRKEGRKGEREKRRKKEHHQLKRNCTSSSPSAEVKG